MILWIAIFKKITYQYMMISIWPYKSVFSFWCLNCAKYIYKEFLLLFILWKVTKYAIRGEIKWTLLNFLQKSLL